jgi:hypothetical protein
MLLDMIKASDCQDPIIGMALIAKDVTQDIHLRFQAYKELTQYIYLKQKAIEVSGESDRPMRYIFKWED